MTCFAFAGKWGGWGASVPAARPSCSSRPASPNIPNPHPTVRNASRRVIETSPPSVHKQKLIRMQESLGVALPAIALVRLQEVLSQLQFLAGRGAAEQDT